MSAIVSSNPNALQPPKHIISLASAAILVDVDVNVWTATKQNRTVSTEVTTLKKASRDSGRFIENLLANDPDHKRILNYRQTIYNWLQRRAFDFAGSQRILPQIDIPVFKTSSTATTTRSINWSTPSSTSIPPSSATWHSCRGICLTGTTTQT